MSELDWQDDPDGRSSVMGLDAYIVTPVNSPYGVRCRTCREVVPAGSAMTLLPDSPGYHRSVCMPCFITETTGAGGEG